MHRVRSAGGRAFEGPAVHKKRLKPKGYDANRSPTGGNLSVFVAPDDWVAVSYRAMGLKPRPPRAQGLSAIRAELIRYALTMPGAHKDYPWGEIVTKVRGKVFVFFGRGEDGSLGLSVKLPQSSDALVAMPFATPTGYGLGRSGWVSITCKASDPLPLELMRSWIIESYRAVAPRKLLKQLDC